MRKVYADNSATSFPKAPGVSDAMKDFLDNAGCNVNRGGYESSYNAALAVLNTRKLLCETFHYNEPRNVVFTPGITYSLNLILKGFLKEGDHVVTTSMEHNSVMRPLHELSRSGVTYDAVPCGPDGSLDVSEMAGRFNARTKAVVMTHASNVCGTVLPVRSVSEICVSRGVKLIVDSAQTAGILDVDMTSIDALAFTAHKGLLASQGLGGFIVKSELAEQIAPLVTGGTGSLSHEITQPDFLPDKFESGTLNLPGIMGLQKSLEYIRSVGAQNIYAKEMQLAERFISELRGIDGVELAGKKDMADRVAVLSLNFRDRDNAEVAAALDSRYGIMTRCGLHCAPGAHKTLRTYPQGTVRFSFGHFNTRDEIDYIAASLKEILAKGA